MAGPISFNAIPSQPSWPPDKKQHQENSRRQHKGRPEGDDAAKQNEKSEHAETELDEEPLDKQADEYVGKNLDLEA